MKVAASAVVMQSSHEKVEVHQRKESARFWVGDAPPRGSQGTPQSDPQNSPRAGERALERSAAVQYSSAAFAREADHCRRCAPPELLDAPREAIEIMVLIKLLERLTGKKIELMTPSDLQPTEGEAAPVESAEGVEAADVEGAGEPAPVGWGLEAHVEETHYESEKTTFTAQGVVVTEDGREITFGIELKMSREVMSHTSIGVRAGDALIDPIVVNFEGPAAELTDTTFEFDLDLDGSADQIAALDPGSGFLALDRNGDGAINDGSELFGPSTGKGFAELARQDEDGNGWIDESDSVFDKLLIWSKDAEGSDRLLGLAEAGVGAIFVQHVSTPFTLADGQGDVQGQLAASSIYLKEDGGVGTVQELDLVV